MKRFTIIFSILLVLGFAGTLGFVYASEDFVEPNVGGSGEDMSTPVWGMSIDELMDYLEEKDLWDRNNMNLLSAGIGTEAYTCSGAEIYWWDVDNLVEGSNEAAAWQNVLDGEPIDLWQMGTSYMSVTKNGPFAIGVSDYTGDATVLLDAFSAFGQNGGADAPVWDMTLDDLAAYMEERGLIDRSTEVKIMSAFDESKILRYNGADFYWWDVEALEEGTEVYDEYQSVKENDFVTYQNGITVMIRNNGPFGLRTSAPTADSPSYDGDTDALVEAFDAFGRE